MLQINLALHGMERMERIAMEQNTKVKRYGNVTEKLRAVLFRTKAILQIAMSTFDDVYCTCT